MVSETDDKAGRQIVLIVDDTPEHITLVNSLLKDLYRIKVATSGEKALEIAFSKDPPDLILLDIEMPEMHGYEVIRHLKSESQTADIPVIFLTAKSDIEYEERGFELGAVDFITKPISPPILLARVQTQLRLKKMMDYLKTKLGMEEFA
jgi:response regulator RpfG family c-di-GMP phosphodiesterase